MQLIIKTVKGEQYSVECEAVRRPLPSVRVRVRVRVRVGQRLRRRPHGQPGPPRRPATPVRLRSVRHALQADSILAVKQKLAAQQSVAEPGLQKLLFSGRVLANPPSLGPHPYPNPDLFSGRVLADTNPNPNTNPDLFSGRVLANTPSPDPNTNPDLFSGRVLANTNLNADPNPNPKPSPSPSPSP